MPFTKNKTNASLENLAQLQDQSVFDVYNIYRFVLSLLLLISFFFRSLTSTLGTINPDLFVNVVVIYLAFNAIVFFRVLLPKSKGLLTSQFISVILIDIVFIILISYTCGGVSSGMANLLIVPVAAGSLLFRSRLSTFSAAVGSILAIYSEVYLYLIIDDGIVYFVQAGLLGLTLFAVSWSLQYLGGKIRQNELLARQQAKNIKSLQEMNNQIIERMHTGILVVTPEGMILTINVAANRFLQIADAEGKVEANIDDSGTRLPEILFSQLQHWMNDNNIKAPPFRLNETSTDLQATFSYLNPGADSNILIFIEDFSLLTSRAQQLKMMSLGRLTASIAHEVRNPLGAISHASQLLNESEEIQEGDQRLLEIITTHSERVNRIIESILDLSRNKAEDMAQFPILEWLNQFVTKFSNSMAVPIEIECNVSPKDIAVLFNSGQLEQVLTNLFENGLRYSEKATGLRHISIEVKKSDIDGNPEMHIMDDGKGIPEELTAQIFEPFFTTEQSGTGLGLFICREICDANRARLSYQPEYKGKSTFQINFANAYKNLI